MLRVFVSTSESAVLGSETHWRVMQSGRTVFSTSSMWSGISAEEDCLTFYGKSSARQRRRLKQWGRDPESYQALRQPRKIRSRGVRTSSIHRTQRAPLMTRHLKLLQLFTNIFIFLPGKFMVSRCVCRSLPQARRFPNCQWIQRLPSLSCEVVEMGQPRSRCSSSLRRFGRTAPARMRPMTTCERFFYRA